MSLWNGRGICVVQRLKVGGRCLSSLSHWIWGVCVFEEGGEGTYGECKCCGWGWGWGLSDGDRNAGAGRTMGLRTEVR